MKNKAKAFIVTSVFCVVTFFTALIFTADFRDFTPLVTFLLAFMYWGGTVFGAASFYFINISFCFFFYDIIIV